MPDILDQSWKTPRVHPYGMVMGEGAAGLLDSWFSENPVVIIQVPGSLGPWS